MEIYDPCLMGRTGMKLHRPLAAAVFCAALCGAVAVVPAANASVSFASPLTATHYFATPLTATQYFADAVNSGDIAALHQVTTPDSFRAVMGMRGEVRDVQAKSCAATGRGDYDCSLKYQLRHQRGTGYWNVIVAPAISPGWYVYQYQVNGCG
jgi:hypothetical protein